MQQNQSRFQVGRLTAAQTPDVAEALKNEQGRFRTYTALAQVSLVECEHGHSIKSSVPIGILPIG